MGREERGPEGVGARDIWRVGVVGKGMGGFFWWGRRRAGRERGERGGGVFERCGGGLRCR